MKVYKLQFKATVSNSHLDAGKDTFSRYFDTMEKAKSEAQRLLNNKGYILKGWKTNSGSGLIFPEYKDYAKYDSISESYPSHIKTVDVH